MDRLSVEKLSKSFEGVLVLDDVSFSVQKAEVFALIGHSGAGKSTILKIIAGLADADGGQVRIGTERVVGASEKLIAGHPDIKMVHQEYNLFPNISLRQNIEYQLRFFEEIYRHERTDELIDLCQISHVQYKIPRMVSGGERQRTAIACAIAEEPKVLLLDEPFSHLDAPNRRRLREVVVNLVRQANLSCVFVTHDAMDVMAVADRVGVLLDGKLTQIDTPSNVFYKPQTREVAELMGEINILTVAQFEEIFENTTPIPFANNEVGVRPSEIKFANLRHSYQQTGASFNGFCTERRIETASVTILIYD